MKLKVLNNEEEYTAALKRADAIFHSIPNTKEGNELAELLLAIKSYEDLHHVVK